MLGAMGLLGAWRKVGYEREMNKKHAVFHGKTYP